MRIIKNTIIAFTLLILASCVDYNSTNIKSKPEKKYYSSFGFALIYDEDLYKQGIVNKKLKNDEIVVMHSFLKRNTPIKIINPENSKFVMTKVSKNANYSKIFNVVISRKITESLNLDIDNPYVEILEIKKNKTFIAKEGTIFEEERNVAGKAPVDEVKINDLSDVKLSKKKIKNKSNFFLVISDFYYLDSANNLKKELIEKTQINNFYVKKINDKKYRLYSGPFKNFNSLKLTYISLNNLGFEDLNIYKKQ